MLNHSSPLINLMAEFLYNRPFLEILLTYTMYDNVLFPSSFLVFLKNFNLDDKVE